jgi:hypothetical protein
LDDGVIKIKYRQDNWFFYFHRPADGLEWMRKMYTQSLSNDIRKYSPALLIPKHRLFINTPVTAASVLADQQMLQANAFSATKVTPPISWEVYLGELAQKVKGIIIGEDYSNGNSGDEDNIGTARSMFSHNTAGAASTGSGAAAKSSRVSTTSMLSGKDGARSGRGSPVSGALAASTSTKKISGKAASPKSNAVAAAAAGAGAGASKSAKLQSVSPVPPTLPDPTPVAVATNSDAMASINKSTKPIETGSFTPPKPATSVNNSNSKHKMLLVAAASTVMSEASASTGLRSNSSQPDTAGTKDSDKTGVSLPTIHSGKSVRGMSSMKKHQLTSRENTLLNIFAQAARRFPTK